MSRPEHQQTTRLYIYYYLQYLLLYIIASTVSPIYIESYI